MATQGAALAKEGLSFGPFTLIANERRLEKNGAPINIGGRAFDVLLILLSRPSEIISKEELLDLAWPGVAVEEGSLRFHVAALRKALGDGSNGARYISTVAGRGYCFTAPVERVESRSDEPRRLVRFPKLPDPLHGLIGRDEDLRKVSVRLDQARLVSIVGSGGVGKTTLALAVGHHLQETFDDGVLLIDLGAVNDPEMVPAVIAAMLGLTVSSTDALPSVIASLRDKHALLILDTCEHLIDAVSSVASRIIAEAPQTYILSTSRETLRIEGEHVYWLEPLAFPPGDAATTAETAQAYPAVQLFVERAVASGAHLVLDDAKAATVAGICRRLDGVALAIELAARRVDIYGLQQTAALLDKRFDVLWGGRRTAPPRQQTLQATLEWSYDLLLPYERQVLRRLSVFVGRFTLDAALAVLSGPDEDRVAMLNAIDSLVSKSLVASQHSSGHRYRLLDTTRAFAADKLAAGGEADGVLLAHAKYFCSLLSGISPQPSGPRRNAYLIYADDLPNVRAALDWSLSDRGDKAVGLRLAAAAAPLFLELSLLAECYRWARRAVDVMPEFERGTPLELDLQVALVISGMFSRGNTPDVEAAIVRGIELAQALNDQLRELKLHLCLHIFQIRSGAIKRSLEIAKPALSLAYRIGDETGIAIAHRMHGISCALSGNRIEAVQHFEKGFARETEENAIDFLGQTHRMGALVAYSRTLWLTGHPSRAVLLAKQAVRASDATSHPVNACNCYAYAAQVFLWSADHDMAAWVIGELIDHADRYSLAAFQAMGLGLKGQLSIALGDHQAGRDLLKAALAGITAERQNTFAAPFRTSFAEALAAGGDFDGALLALEAAQRLAEETGGQFHLPETLRLKGAVLASKAGGDLAEAEAALLQSIDMARAQGSPGWELRSTVTLANLHLKQGERARTRNLLVDFLERFSGESEMAGLSEVRKLMEAVDG
jgi:predicted ATPase/DNA-binding winged helix-turn-helix (wHTH) protein